MANDLINLGGTFMAPGPLLLRGAAWKSNAASIGANGVYTPDTRVAIEHNITVTGTPVTIANPLVFPLAEGFAPVLLTHIRNASGAPIVTTWGSKYRQPAFVDPADGSGVVTLWHYDATNDAWYCSGRNVMVT